MQAAAVLVAGHNTLVTFCDKLKEGEWSRRENRTGISSKLRTIVRHNSPSQHRKVEKLRKEKRLQMGMHRSKKELLSGFPSYCALLSSTAVMKDSGVDDPPNSEAFYSEPVLLKYSVGWQRT